MTFMARVTYRAPDTVNDGHLVEHERHVGHPTQMAAVETCSVWRAWAERQPDTVTDVIIEIEHRDHHGNLVRVIPFWPTKDTHQPSPAGVAAWLAHAREALER